MATDCDEFNPLDWGANGFISSGISSVEAISSSAMDTLSTSLSALSSAASAAINAITTEITVDNVEVLGSGDSYAPPDFGEDYNGQEVVVPGILESGLENEYIPSAYPQNNTGTHAPQKITITVDPSPQNNVGAPPSDVPGTISTSSKPQKPTLDKPSDVAFYTPQYSGFSDSLLSPTPPEPPSLDFGTIGPPPTVVPPSFRETAPTLLEPGTVIITDPDISGIMSTFNGLVGNAPADPDFSYVDPDYQWLLSRIDAAQLPPDPDISFTAPDFSSATSILSSAISETLERPELDSVTPIDIDVNFTDPPPETAALESEAVAMKTLANAFLPEVLTTNTSLLSATDADFATNGLEPIITALKDRLGDFLSASEDRIGLPVVVENAMRDRAFSGVDKESFKLERQAVENWLSRGFSLPGGILAAQTQSIQQLGFDKKNELSRDIFIESAKLKLEALWNAIKTGIDYEFKHREYHQRTVELAIKVTDARLSAYKDVVSAYAESLKVQLSIWQGLLQVKELQSKLVLTRADAEIKRLQGAISLYEADAKLIATRIGAVDGLIKIGLADVDIQKAENDAKIEEYKAKVSAYSSELDATKALTSIPALKADLEKTRIGAESDEYKAKSDGWRTQLQVFPETVKAELYKVDASKARVDSERLRVEYSGALIQGYQAEIEGAKAKVSAEDAKVRGYTAEVGGYEARIRGETAKISQFSAMVDYEKTKSAYNDVIAKKAALELEKDKLQVTKNQYEVEQYQAKVNYEKTKADFFAAEVQAFQAEINAAIQDFEAFKAQIQGYAAQVQGYSAEVQGYSAKNQGEESRARLYGSEAQAFAEHVRAYGAELEGWKTQEMGAIETEKARQSASVAMMQGAVAAMEKIIERNKGEMMAYDAAARKYAAQVDAKKTSYQVDVENKRIDIANKVKELQIKVQTATTKLEKATEISRILIGAFSAEAGSAAQISAGALSALHMSASVSGSTSMSKGQTCSTNYSYEM